MDRGAEPAFGSIRTNPLDTAITAQNVRRVVSESLVPSAVAALDTPAREGP